MFRIPKMMENRHCAILVHGISTIEIKISHITEQEVVGTYSDGEEVHVIQEAIFVWWPDAKRAARSEAGKRTAAKRQLKSANLPITSVDGTIACEEPEEVI